MLADIYYVTNLYKLLYSLLNKKHILTTKTKKTTFINIVNTPGVEKIPLI